MTLTNRLYNGCFKFICFAISVYFLYSRKCGYTGNTHMQDAGHGMPRQNLLKATIFTANFDLENFCQYQKFEICSKHRIILKR